MAVKPSDFDENFKVKLVWICYVSDRSFLIKMMDDKDACMVGCDKHLAVSEKK